MIKTPTLFHDVAPTDGSAGSDRPKVRGPWVRPVLRQLGSVAQVTGKVDNSGKWDGVFVIGMSRT